MMGRQRRCRWAQPWTLLLLLLGPQPLGSHIWGPAEKEGDDEERLLNYLPATVEYALHMYNLTNQGRNAYKVVRVLRSWKDPVGTLPCCWCTPAVNEGLAGVGGCLTRGLDHHLKPIK